MISPSFKVLNGRLTIDSYWIEESYQLNQKSFLHHVMDAFESSDFLSLHNRDQADTIQCSLSVFADVVYKLMFCL